MMHDFNGERYLEATSVPLKLQVFPILELSCPVMHGTNMTLVPARYSYAFGEHQHRFQRARSDHANVSRFLQGRQTGLQLESEPVPLWTQSSYSAMIGAHLLMPDLVLKNKVENLEH